MQGSYFILSAYALITVKLDLRFVGRRLAICQLKWICQLIAMLRFSKTDQDLYKLRIYIGLDRHRVQPVNQKIDADD